MISGNVWSVSGFSLVPTSEGRDDFFSATLDMFSLLGVGAKKNCPPRTEDGLEGEKENAVTNQNDESEIKILLFRFE